MCGDSNIANANTENGNIPKSSNFGTILMNRLGLDFECHAKYGASNDRIIRKTNEWIESQSGDKLTVFIGWSTWEREEWEHNGEFFDVDNFSLNSSPKSQINKYEKWLEQSSKQEHMDTKACEWEEKIHIFIDSLLSRNINFLMWNSYIPLEHGSNTIKSKHFINPYDSDSTLYWYLKRVMGHQPMVDDPYHFDDVGHRLWADFLFKYITENDVL